MIKNIESIIITLLLLFGCGYHAFNMDEKESYKGIYYDNLNYTDNVTINSLKGIELDYDASLNKVGDYFEIKFDVVNDSGVDVEISDLLVHENDEYINYDLTYSNGQKINNGDILKKGSKKKLKYKVSYLNNINQTGYTFDSEFSINYSQVI